MAFVFVTWRSKAWAARSAKGPRAFSAARSRAPSKPRISIAPNERRAIDGGRTHQGTSPCGEHEMRVSLAFQAGTFKDSRFLIAEDVAQGSGFCGTTWSG